MIGRQLSHYRIVEQIGHGPVGTVYRAQDLHLDRSVALKILRTPAADNPDREQLFIVEAKAASGLNHPNIAAIYDIDQDSGIHFIAMELVRGKSLAQILGKRGLPISQVYKLAIQISEGLAAAHAAGIVHRDLKPVNIMVTETGVVKLLDFGLGKLTEPLALDVSEKTVSLSDLRVPDDAQPVCYLAPEQVMGKPADKRSDVFSFGCILYEMLTGRPAFAKEGELTAPQAVVDREPKPIQEVAADVPYDLVRVVNRCLRKDATRRFQLMEDLKLTLEELKEESESRPIVAAYGEGAAKTPPWSKPLWLAMMVAVLGGGAYLGLRVYRNQGPSAPHFKLIQLTRDSGVTQTAALSPDGKLVAYSSDREDGDNLDLWVQHVDGGGAVRLTTHPAADHSPAFSPDGTRVVFCSERDGGGVYVMPALGGEARLIAKAGRLPRFSPDGSRIAYFVSPQGGITGSKMFIVASDGSGTTQLQQDFTAAAVPVWTPKGDAVMFYGIHPTEGGDVWVAPINGGSAVRTGAGAILQKQGIEIKTLDGLSEKGDSLYFSGSFGDSTNIWRMPISPGNWLVGGPAERLTSGAAELSASMSRNGRVVFTSATRTSRLYTVSVDDDGGVRGELAPATPGGAQDTSCDISADGSTLVYRSNRSGTVDIWIRDIKAGKDRALTQSTVSESMPRISADGKQVAFSVMQNGKRVMYVVPAEGGVAEAVCHDCGPPAGFSPDGTHVFYTRIAAPHAHINVLDLATKQTSKVMLDEKMALYGGRVSQDKRWFSFKGDLDVARTVVFAAPLGDTLQPARDTWVQINEGTSWDDLPRWAPGGNLMYFTSDRDGFRCIWARRLDPQTKKPVGDSFAVIHLHKMQLSMANLSLAEFELASGKGRLVFPMAELRGNIWLLEPDNAR
ncbi:MAG: serine/threonine-protein kinase [Bryobacterales bacterium]|nr:serine/threonine-protein kinase [Bryobacterales bacterium]